MTGLITLNMEAKPEWIISPFTGNFLLDALINEILKIKKYIKFKYTNATEGPLPRLYPYRMI